MVWTDAIIYVPPLYSATSPLVKIKKVSRQALMSVTKFYTPPNVVVSPGSIIAQYKYIIKSCVPFMCP